MIYADVKIQSPGNKIIRGFIISATVIYGLNPDFAVGIYCKFCVKVISSF